MSGNTDSAGQLFHVMLRGGLLLSLVVAGGGACLSNSDDESKDSGGSDVIWHDSGDSNAGTIDADVWVGGGETHFTYADGIHTWYCDTGWQATGTDRAGGGDYSWDLEITVDQSSCGASNYSTTLDVANGGVYLGGTYVGPAYYQSDYIRVNHPDDVWDSFYVYGVDNMSYAYFLAIHPY